MTAAPAILTTRATFTKAAIEFVRAYDLPVIPVAPSGPKRPLLSAWAQRATTEEATIVGWGEKWPDANPGMPTGRRTGRMVLDADLGAGGVDALHELQREHGELPTTVEVQTGGGGEHRHFRRPNVRSLGNSRGALPAGIDVRCDGGQVVVPPSTHESGRRYEWSLDGHPDEVALAEPPQWLLDLILAKSQGRTYRKEGLIPRGRRNNTLTSLAGGMRRNGMGEAEIAAALHVTNATRCTPPLPVKDVDGIARSIAARHMAPEWVLDPIGFADDPGLDPRARLVLLHLCRRANHEGGVHGGAWLSEVTGFHRNRISAAVKALERTGRLEVTFRSRKPGLANRYRVLASFAVPDCPLRPAPW